jgi:hypothetical protein
MPRRDNHGCYIFPDYPEFRPNLSPREIFKLGAFGGTYWRPIYSKVTKKEYKNEHRKFPKSWFKGIPEDHLTRPWNEYDKSINKYKVKVGTTLEFWESKHWITKYDPYGQCEWYCNFFLGRRCPDDERQIKRWLQTAGPNSRFRIWLCNQIKKSRKKYNDYSVSPAIRQTLLHWGYELTLRDYNEIINH